MRSYKAGKILEVYFPYEDTEDEKRRPALVLKDYGDELLLLKITSQHHGRRWDVEIPTGEYNGLSRASVIQVDRAVRLKKTRLLNVIPRGTLTEMQLGLVKLRLQEYIRESN